MTQYHHTIQLINEHGLHHQAAEKLSELSSQFHAEITVCRNGIIASAKSISSLMSLAAGKSCEIELRATGPQAEIALSALIHLINNKFYEGDFELQ